jgi:outer membrane immunogenic protein
MKRFVGALAIASAAAGSAFAADMPLKAPPPPAPVYSWNGWYVGGNAGGIFADNDLTSVVSPTPDAALGVIPGVSAGLAALASVPVPLGHKSGFIGGAQLGYNWQSGSYLAGLEADIQGISGTGSSGAVTTTAIVVGASVTSTQTASMSTDYLGTLRGRLGWLFTPTFLVYGTGGLAYGGVNATTSLSQVGTNGFVGNGAAALSETRVGWTAGAGFEWMFAQNWSAKVEYLHYDLGTTNFPSVATSAFFATPIYQTTVNSASFSGDVVRGGVNWHF